VAGKTLYTLQSVKETEDDAITLTRYTEMEVARWNRCVVQSCVTGNFAHEKELSIRLRKL